MSRKLLLLLCSGLLLSACGKTSSAGLTAAAYCGTNGCKTSYTTNSASLAFSTNNATINKQYSLYSAGLISGQSMQLSGSCNAGGAVANSITYTITNTVGTVFANDIYGVAYSSSARAAVCENGKFTMLVTPPNDGINTLTYCTGCVTVSSVTTPVNNKSFQINVTLSTGPDSTHLAAGPTFSGTIYAQE